ncbi:DDE-domain-containing protein, partial [Wilcoxina mikolae CBS 423.85]
NWITRFLNRHPILVARFASRKDRQRAYASNPHTIQTDFQKLGKVMRARRFSDKAITNIDEKGFVMGISPRTKVVTRRGKKNPRIKQDGKREFIPALEEVSADGFVFTPYLIGKGSVHIFGWYKNVGGEDQNARRAVSPKGWTDSKIGYYWLTNVYDPISKAHCPGEPRLLILDGHVSHINYKFLTFCEANDIVVFCLPLHSTHVLQPLDVALFAPLQLAYRQAIEDYFLTTAIGINRDLFFPLYKETHQQAYTLRNITVAFKNAELYHSTPALY